MIYVLGAFVGAPWSDELLQSFSAWCSVEACCVLPLCHIFHPISHFFYQMDTLNSIQANNCYQFTRDVARTKGNNIGIKAIHATLNKPCWKITSSACAASKGGKFQYYARAHECPNSVRGEKKHSSCIIYNVLHCLNLQVFSLTSLCKSFSTMKWHLQ